MAEYYKHIAFDIQKMFPNPGEAICKEPQRVTYIEIETNTLLNLINPRRGGELELVGLVQISPATRGNLL